MVRNKSMTKFLPALGLVAVALAAQSPPRFEVDPTWPKPLPEGWVWGRLGGVCVDSHDHIAVVDRRDITAEEAETSRPAPPITVFDAAGNVIASFGDPKAVPESIHGCSFDQEDNIWVGGNGDGIVQKYSHDGKLLLQIGKRRAFDTSDGTRNGNANNSGQDRLFLPAGVAVDPANGDIYVADGYGNRRVAVFDKTGKFLRQWGRQATPEETRSGVPGAFARLVHCIAMGNNGLLYVCDRQGDRVQVFDKAGTFQRNIWIRTGAPKLPDPRGTAWWVAFSRDPEQKFLYVMNGRNEQVHILDHASGRILTSFGRPGHQIGNFIHGHAIAVDSQGNLYVAETDWGRRVQRFRPAEGR
jgi:DNA-binding beta-propeller fold protein YncE